MNTMTALEKEAVADAEEAIGETFTDYVRALDEERPTAGPTDLHALFDNAWQALRRTLARELRRRSLWSSSPTFVGLYGWESWSTDGPLEELLPDCYISIFHRQLGVLQAQLRVNPTIDALVVFFVRNFLTERQKDHDPLGYRLYEILRAAVRDALREGELHAVGGRTNRKGKPVVGNSTVLAASADASAGAAVNAAVLRPMVERWNRGLLPGLVTAGGEERRRIVAQLRRHLFELEAEGIAVFRFKDLIDPMKHDVRSRWAALYEFGDGDLVTQVESDEGGDTSRALVRIFHPDHRAEEKDAFHKLVSCVSELIERLEERDRTRHYLDNLWGFLRRFALDATRERLPSHRKIGEELRIPRERLPGLYGKLEQLIRRCRETLAGTVVEIDSKRPPPGGSRG